MALGAGVRGNETKSREKEHVLAYEFAIYEDSKVGMAVNAVFVDQGGGVCIPKFEPA